MNKSTISEVPGDALTAAAAEDAAGMPTEKSPRKRPTPHPISSAVSSYIQTMRGIALTAQTVLPHTSLWLIAEVEKTEKRIAKFIPGFPNASKDTKLELKSAREYAEFTNSLKNLNDIQSNCAPSVLARALFMQMFSEFDAFTGKLLKAIYLKNDALLKGISREISLCDLLDHRDLDSVKRAMLEKEIDSFRRDSYVEQLTCSPPAVPV